MALSSSAEMVSMHVESYMFDISGGVDTYYDYPDRPKVLRMVWDEIHIFNPRLRSNIKLNKEDFAKASDEIARNLAIDAYRQRCHDNPINAAHLYRMASGAERVSRNNLGNDNGVIKGERAALELIYMADAVQALGEAGKGEAFGWCLKQSSSLKQAYRMIEMQGRIRSESPSPQAEDRILDRVSEAYKRGKIMVSGI